MKLAKTYEPAQYEANIYALWETATAFAPNPDTSKGVFSIVMPPPNANGNLHIGHALMVAIEDILIRYHRQKGESTVYIPGADHAGFETWVVFERQLEKEGKSRFDYSREELYQMVWEFVAAHRGNMEIQLRELGASTDWTKLVFTLDKNVIDTSYKTFKKLWDEGLVYRGKRLVNYCTKHHTGFADIEVEYEDRTTPLYYLKYGPFTLATTRPETKFGDTAVAVHPSDERYKALIGKTIEVEGVNGPFTVKIVADEHVDPTFGTGAVKVTPAHDFNDWDIAQRHNLPVIQVIDQNGKLTKKAGRFAGLTVLEARQAVVKALEEKDLLVKVDTSYKNRVGVCYKCKTVIEPMLLDQWFIKIKPLVTPAIEAIEQGRITFHPANKGKVLVNYLRNLHDWNISRQIPWGIPVPAFQNIDQSDDWIFDTRVEQEIIEVAGKTYRRDPDTFDTWFSSGQWPFITTAHNPGGGLREYYPTSVMETGHDILVSWVARMVMLGLYITPDIPFKDVYLHGLVMDEKGQKMSKSKGNVLSPQDIVTEFGSDALRMGLVANRGAGTDQAFSKATVVAGRNFANKLWNIARYIEDKVGDSYQQQLPEPKTPADHWVLQQLSQACKRITSLLDTYRFGEAYEALYHLLWDDIADWYIEASKSELNKSLLGYLLENLLKLAHPFAPFVTETIWQTLKWQDGFLMHSSWPETIATFDQKAARTFTQLQAVITEIRFVTNELGGNPQELVFRQDKLIETHSELVKHMARLKHLQQLDQPKGLRLALASHELWLAINADDLKNHRTKLETRLQTCQEDIAKLKHRLSNDSYVKNAPKVIVKQTEETLKEKQALQTRLVRELELLT